MIVQNIIDFLMKLAVYQLQIMVNRFIVTHLFAPVKTLKSTEATLTFLSLFFQRLSLKSRMFFLLLK